MASLECVRVLEGHNEAVLALAVGPTFLVSGSYDTTVRFWGLETLRCIRHAPTCPALVHPACSHCFLRQGLQCLGLHASRMPGRPCASAVLRGWRCWEPPGAAPHPTRSPTLAPTGLPEVGLVPAA